MQQPSVKRRAPGLRCAILAAAFLLTFAGCPSPERDAKERFDLARFEEQQGNVEHARQVYEEIIAAYPETSWGAQARDRLAELQKAAP